MTKQKTGDGASRRELRRALRALLKGKEGFARWMKIYKLVRELEEMPERAGCWEQVSAKWEWNRRWLTWELKGLRARVRKMLTRDRVREFFQRPRVGFLVWIVVTLTVLYLTLAMLVFMYNRDWYAGKFDDHVSMCRTCGVPLSDTHQHGWVDR